MKIYVQFNINVRENRMDNQEKLAALGTQDKLNNNKKGNKQKTKERT